MEVVENGKIKLFDKTEKAFNSASRILSYIGTGFVVVMMLLTVGDVFLRFTFRHPIVGILELTEYFMIIIAFFALAWGELNQRHIKVDLVVKNFSPRIQAIIASVTYVLGLCVLVLITWQNFIGTVYQWKVQRASAMLQIPAYPFYIALSVGCLFFCVAMVINLVKSVKEATKR